VGWSALTNNDGTRRHDTRVAVLPITPTAPHDAATAIALPDDVKRSLGPDSQPSWVCLDELNVFSWPGYDLRTIPGTNRIDYSALPRPLFERIRNAYIALYKARRPGLTERDKLPKAK
jgi:hypothetical protein